MTLTPLVAYLVWVASAVLLYVTLTVLVPGVARAVYARRIEAIHDKLDDAMLDGDLDDCHEVRSLLGGLRAAIVGAAPRPSVSLLWALHRSHREVADRVKSTYGHLPPAQRKYLHEVEAEFSGAVRSVIIWGSPFWLVNSLMVAVGHALGEARGEAVATTPGQLADEFVSVGTNRPALAKKLGAKTRNPVHAH